MKTAFDRTCATVQKTRTMPQGTALIIRRLILPLLAVYLLIPAERGAAQAPFPAPLPNQEGTANSSPFPPVNGSAPASLGAPMTPQPIKPFPTAPLPPGSGAPMSSPMGGPQFGQTPQAAPPDDCMKQFVPLRQDAENKGKLIKQAGDRHATPQEACKLIGNFGSAELKMIKFVESHAAKCGIPPHITDQMKAGHKNTEALQKKVCAVAEQAQRQGPAGPSLSDVLGSSASAPDQPENKRGGGSTFDTLNGNVLTR